MNKKKRKNCHRCLAQPKCIANESQPKRTTECCTYCKKAQKTRPTNQVKLGEKNQNQISHESQTAIPFSVKRLPINRRTRCAMYFHASIWTDVMLTGLCNTSRKNLDSLFQSVKISPLIVLWDIDAVYIVAYMVMATLETMLNATSFA